ncbi:MAG: RNA 2',3'-cyclic phosphodiesterase [Sphingomonas sp.]
MHRLFVALRPPPAIRASLAAAMGGVPHARWQDDEQLHLTLRFIGEVDRPQAEDIAAALGQVHAEAPVVAIAGVGRFTRAGRTDAIWAGVAPRQPLADLHARVDRALAQAGLAPDNRAYLPHVTLARLPRGAASEPAIDRFLAERAGLTSTRFALEALLLFESRLGHEGARYEAIARYPLG